MKSLVLAAVVVASAAVVPPPAVAGAVTCQGLPATIVGPGGDQGYLVGTPGPDVIVTAGATDVWADEGDDHVCVTDVPPGDGGYFVRVDAGGGSDSVSVDDPAYDRGISVELGPGDDELVGGPGTEYVDGESGLDRITTGDGNDVVSVGSDPQQIDLGRGADRLSLLGSASVPEGSVLRGGPGSDLIRLTGLDDARVTVRMAQQQIVVDGVERIGSWFSFEGVSLDSDEPGSLIESVDFHGTAAADRLSVAGARRVTAQLGAGADEFFIGRAGRGTGQVDGGPGRDRLDASSTTSWTVLDLSRGVITSRSRTAKVIRISGFRDATLSFPGVLVGDDLDNLLVADCGRIDGRGGDDLLRQGHVISDAGAGAVVRPGRCNDDGFIANGGPGDDDIVGSRTADVLNGGPGRDRIDGEGGPDRCRAEVRVRCETDRL